MAKRGFGATAFLASGGVVHGPGTGTSDSIRRKVPVGDYIMPADSTRKLDVMLSNGERQIPAGDVHKLGAMMLEAMRQATHIPTRQPQLGARRKMADGGFAGPLTDPEAKPAPAATAVSPATPTPQAGGTPSTGQPAGTAASVMSGGAFGLRTAGETPAVSQSVGFGASPSMATGLGPTAAPALGASPAMNPGMSVMSGGAFGLKTMNDPGYTRPGERPAAGFGARQPGAASTMAAPSAPAASGGLMDWQARNDRRNLEVSASSISDSPERRAARSALSPQPAQQAGGMPGMTKTGTDASGQWTSYTRNDLIRRYADGGPVDEERQRSQGGAVADAARTLFPGVTATLAGSGEDASAAMRTGNYGAAAGHVARGAIALGAAAGDDVLGRPYRALVLPAAAGVANAAYTAATGEDTLPSAAKPAPAPVNAPTPAAGTAGAGRGFVNPASANPNGPGPTFDTNATVTLGGQPGATVDGAPGVSKFKTADGRTLYSNVTGTDNDKLMSGKPGVQVAPGFGAVPPGSPIAGGNTAASPALSSPALGAQLSAARQAAAARGDWQAVSNSYGGNFAGGAAMPDTPGVMSNGSGAIILSGMTLAKDANNRFNGTPSLSTLGAGAISGREAARLANARTIASEQNATSAQNAQVSAGASRYGVDAQTGLGARRLALEQQNAGVSNELTRAQAASANQTVADKKRMDALQSRYLAETDPTEKAAMAVEIRTLMGKDAQQDRIVTVGGGQVWDAQANGGLGAMRQEPQRAYNAATGQWLEPPGAGAKLPPGMTRQVGTAPKYKTGKVYVDGQGRKAKWDGSKFVPA